ncbi:uncharacterized protein V6R79_018184 [Siganus canaliculatus]
MRSNMASCELITDPSRFTQFCFISDDVAMVQWRHADARGSRIKEVNVFVGAMTTAYARLMLYDLLNKLNEINDGDVCGLDSEDFITEFVSGGPKCYAYRTRLGKTVLVKCKGVTLNSKNSAIVTQETLLALVKATLRLFTSDDTFTINSTMDLARSTYPFCDNVRTGLHHSARDDFQDNRPSVNKLQRKRKSKEKTDQVPVSVNAYVAEQHQRPGVVRPEEETLPEDVPALHITVDDILHPAAVLTDSELISLLDCVEYCDQSDFGAPVITSTAVAPEADQNTVVRTSEELLNDVQAVLHARDQYSPDVFLEEIAQVLQSNDTSMTDDELEFIVTVARDRSGGARLKLGSVPYEDILKGKHLYNPVNVEDHLCFSICLAHAVNHDEEAHRTSRAPPKRQSATSASQQSSKPVPVSVNAYVAEQHQRSGVVRPEETLPEDVPALHITVDDVLHPAAVLTDSELISLLDCVEYCDQSDFGAPVITSTAVAPEADQNTVVRTSEELLSTIPTCLRIGDDNEQSFLNGLGLDSDIAGLSEINRLCLELSDLQPRTVSNAVVPLSCNKAAQTTGVYVDAGTQTVENVAQDIAGLNTELNIQASHINLDNTKPTFRITHPLPNDK